MNTESREPITDADHAPPRTLWYHATLGAEEATTHLAQRHPGSYLVRKSPKHADSYRLSVVDSSHVSSVFFLNTGKRSWFQNELNMITLYIVPIKLPFNAVQSKIGQMG